MSNLRGLNAAIAVPLLAFLALSLAVAVGCTAMWDGHMSDMMGRGMMGGAGQSTIDSPEVTGGMTETVVMKDSKFTPGNLSVPVGATVTWVNEDSAVHNAASLDGSWETRMLSKGQQASIRFDAPGEYTYYCVAHPNMKAQLRVE
jgi:plastocyanin